MADDTAKPVPESSSEATPEAIAEPAPQATDELPATERTPESETPAAGDAEAAASVTLDAPASAESGDSAAPTSEPPLAAGQPEPEAVAETQPEPEPAPAQAMAAAEAQAEAEAAAVVARTIEVPPLEPGADAAMAGEAGGEWALLMGKLREWLASGELQRIWSQARTPLTAIAALIGVLLVLRIYSSLLGAIDSLPLVPGLLELVGLVWLLRYGLPKLVRRGEREQLINDLKKRRQDFLG
jgi:hypothetical protein